MNSDDERSFKVDATTAWPPGSVPLRDPVLPVLPLDIALPPQNPLGQYQLLGVLGRGGMGVVYQAVHLRLQKEVAVKVVSTKRLQDPGAVARFEREMQSVGRLEHPHIVGASDAGEISGTHYLVMELVRGANLAQLVKTRGPLKIADACEAVRQAALGLQHVHECGLVHRDIKPSNLLLSSVGVVKVSDLGLARLRSDVIELSGLPADELTATGQLLGTADFMAPEQATNMKSVDIRADVYSLGCTLYMLLTGQPPFCGPDFESTVSKLVAHASKSAPLPRTLRPEIPEQLEVAVMRLLAKSPDDRVPTPVRVAELLSPFVAGCNLPDLVAERTVRDAEMLAASHASTIDRHRTTFAQRVDEAPRRDDLGENRVLTSAIPGLSKLRRNAAWGALAVVVAVATILWISLGPDDESAEKGAPVSPAPHQTPATDDGADSVDNSAAVPGTAELDDIMLRPDEWISVLKRQPKLAIWTRVAEESMLRYNPQRHSLVVSSKGMTLLELGHTDAPHLAMQLLISQPAWEGGIGVFFGFHDSEELGPSVKRFLAVTVQHSRQGGADHLTATMKFIEMDELGVVRRTHESPIGEPIPIPSRPQLLETVVREQTVSVRLGNDRPLTALADPMRFVLPADYQGKFGLFIMDASGTFENVRVKFPSQESTP